MLNKEDSRRLAQLERQLRRDDPEFCALMNTLAGPTRRHVSLPTVAAASAIWFAALVLGVSGWWVPAAIAAVWAAVVAGMLVINRP